MSAFFSGAETALFSYQPDELKRRSDAEGADGLIAALRSHPKRLLITILFGNMVVNVVFFSVSFLLLLDLEPHLGAGGVVALNIESIGWRDEIVNSIAATLGTRFANVVALPIAEPPNRLGNIILLASDRQLELPRELPIPDYRFSPEYDRAHAWDNRFEPDTRNALILADDRNPVDLWGERINFAARKELHEYFADAGVSW